MNLEALKLPVSDELPCGPDLNADVDPEYDEYYFGALGRLPDFFVQPGMTRPDQSRTPDRYFDPKSVDQKAEAEAIGALLERSRDIRLLTLLAQWEILCGRLGPMVDAVETIAVLLQTFPETVHPALDGGVSERRDALEELTQVATVVQPLIFIGLTGSTEVTLRKIRIANGEGTPLEGEEDLSIAALMAALAAAGNRGAVDKSFAAFSRLLAALLAIEHCCQSNPGAPFSPDLGSLKTVVEDVLERIRTARPDLGKVSGAASAQGADPGGQDGGSRPLLQLPTPAAGEARAERSADSGPAVVSHAHARRVLETCETYFCNHEPSSAAQLLITQARLLIGKPFIEALKTLLPQQAEAAAVDFGPQTGFRINAERLFQLTQEVAGRKPADEAEDAISGPAFVVSGPETALTALLAVETYFRRTERSSPVPLLLQRARVYLDMDFQTLIDELIPNQPT